MQTGAPRLRRNLRVSGAGYAGIALANSHPMAAASLYRVDHDDPQPGDEAYSAPTRIGSLDSFEIRQLMEDEGIVQEHTVLMPSAPPKARPHAGDYALAALEALPPAPLRTPMVGFAATIPPMPSRTAPARRLPSRARRFAWRIAGSLVVLAAVTAALYLAAVVAL